MYERVSDLKCQNTNLKILLSLGGWNFNDCAGAGSVTCSYFSEAVRTSENRQIFISNVIAFLRENNFDGIDIDWEYPVVAGHNDATAETPNDKQNLVRLVSEFRFAFLSEGTSTGRDRLLVTAAVGIGNSVVASAYDVPSLCHETTGYDWINLMTYDFHGSWETVSGHHAALYSTSEDETQYGYPISVSWALQNWLDLGCTGQKLTLGIATYGHSFTLENSINHDFLVGVSGPGAQGSGTSSPGTLAYSEVMLAIEQGTLTEIFDEDRGVPYAHDGQGFWVGYDNPRSVGLKCDLIKSKQLLGAMNWALDLDIFQNMEYPLLNRIATDLNIAYGVPVTDCGLAAVSNAPTISRAPTTIRSETSFQETCTSSDSRVTNAWCTGAKGCSPNSPYSEFCETTSGESGPSPIAIIFAVIGSLCGAGLLGSFICIKCKKGNKESYKKETITAPRFYIKSTF